MKSSRNSHKTALLQGAFLIVGACALLLGISRGEVQTVLMKAIRVCLECIGIG